MGCPTSGGCTGYELRADLTFDENGDGQMTATGDPTYWNGGNGWLPLGNATVRYATTFQGNGHTVSYLYVNRSSTDYAGLFGLTNPGASIRNLGLPHADVRGRDWVGALAGTNLGTIAGSWTTGTVDSRGGAGGLAGSSRGAIRASWSTATVSNSIGSPIARAAVGGLAGEISTTGNITASWSGGRVDGTPGGGLVGSRHGAATVTNSYWDTGTSGRSTSSGGVGKTTRDLQRPTGYGGIYASWNIDTDGVTGGDDPWDFGTSRQYPALKFTGRTT